MGTVLGGFIVASSGMRVQAIQVSLKADISETSAVGLQWACSRVNRAEEKVGVRRRLAV